MENLNFLLLWSLSPKQFILNIAPVRQLNFFQFNNLYLLFFTADDEFQKLCFAFGLELDEVVSSSIFYIFILKSINLKTVPLLLQ